MSKELQPPPVRGLARISAHFEDTGMVLATPLSGQSHSFIAEFDTPPDRFVMFQKFWYAGERLSRLPIGDSDQFLDRIRITEWIVDDPDEVAMRLFPRDGEWITVCQGDENTEAS